MIKTIKIDDIINKEYNIYSGLDKYMYLNNEIDTNNLTYEYEGIEDLTKEIKKNDKIGILKIKNNDKIIYQQDIYLDKKINFYNIKIYIICLSILILVLIFTKNRKK